MKSITFVRRMFREYYSNAVSLNHSVSMVEKREFGFLSFEGQMLRHKGFQNMAEITSFLRDFTPKDAYFSCAYYENPEAEMEMKTWLGADLIFDIDADHVPTLCNKIHDEWTCGNCGFVGKGITPEKCPVCNSEKFDVNTWPCEECLASAKMETIKLLEMLKEDFGLSESEIRTFFSGHRGYHVHIEGEAVRTLNSVERKEIVDYVSGLGLNFESYIPEGKTFKRNIAYEQRAKLNFGWRKRLILGIKSYIEKTEEKDFAEIGLEKRFASALKRNKDAILKHFQESGSLGYVKGVGPQTWNRIIKYVAKMEAANVDTVVTTDIHRLIRLSETLNGKTGLKKVELTASDIDDFDPFNMAIAFKKGFVDVKVYDAPKFRLGEEAFGPYKNQRVELPTAAAVLLLCRDRAEVI